MPGEKQPSIAGFAGRDGLLMPPLRLLLPGDISQSPNAILEAPTGFEFGEEDIKILKQPNFPRQTAIRNGRGLNASSLGKWS